MKQISEFIYTLEVFYFTNLHDTQLLPRFPSLDYDSSAPLPYRICHPNFFRGVFSYLSGLIGLIFWQPLINVLGGQMGARRSFGYALVFFIVLTVGTIVVSIYTCLFPRRIILWEHDKLINSGMDGTGVYPDNTSLDSPDSHLLWLVIHFVLGHWVLINLVFHYFMAASMDPGRVPVPLPHDLPKCTGGVTMCQRCVLPRPPRAHHCGICRCCIMRMDHHCPWLANCVGCRNHKHFFLFLSFFTFGGAYLIAVARYDFLAHFEELKASKSEALCLTCGSHEIGDSLSCFSVAHAGVCIDSFFLSSKWTVQILFWLHWLVASCYNLAIIAVIASASICAWHARLITRGETSIEFHLNKRFTRHLAVRRNLIYSNLYDFGVWLNWTRFLGLVDSIYEEKTVETHDKSSKFFGIAWFSSLFFLRRFVIRVLFPSTRSSLDSQGMWFEMNFPTIDDILLDITEQQ